MALVPGGFAHLTAAEIARLLQGVPRGPFLAGMLKEAGDMHVIKDLERALWARTTALSAEGNWPTKRGEPNCRRMAGLAVYEFLMERPVKCATCRGRGYVRQDGNGVACPSCLSSGGQKMSSRMRAELVCMPFETWRSEWAPRYEAVHSVVQSWHSEALSRLARALRDMQDAA